MNTPSTDRPLHAGQTVEASATAFEADKAWRAEGTPATALHAARAREAEALAENEKLRGERSRSQAELDARFRKASALTQKLASIKKTHAAEVARNEAHQAALSEKLTQAETATETAENARAALLEEKNAAEGESREANAELERRFHEIAVLTGRLDEAERARDGAIRMQRRTGLLLDLANARLRARAWPPGLRRTGLPSRRREIALLKTCSLFDAAWYRDAYPDVAGAGREPLVHFVKSGVYEGRNPGPNFDTMAYYEANPDVARAGFNALVHYLLFGRAESRPFTP